MHTTSLLLSNLHCPSCVSTIEDSLLALQPKPSSVSSSIVSSWVTVRHGPSLSPTVIRIALEDAGFDIRGVYTSYIHHDIQDGGTEVPGEEHVRPQGRMMRTPQHGEMGELGDGLLSEENLFLDRTVNEWVLGVDKRRSGKRYMRITRHVELCALCQAEEKRGADKKSPPPLPDRAQPTHQDNMPYQPSKDVEANPGLAKGDYSGTSSLQEVEKSDPSFVVIDDGDAGDLFCASLAVGGMTCAACVNSIKEGLLTTDWIKKVDINLIMGSATVEFTGRHRGNEVSEMIESIGFEAALDSVTKVQHTQASTPQRGGFETDKKLLAPRRTVEIRIAGMYCPQCPERIVRFMDSFKERGVRVEKELSMRDPIMEISYTPEAPDFTVRQIISGLAAVDPTLVPSLYHPPTLEERSRLLHAQERRLMLKRVMLTVIIAIPTFVIGIVFMSLVPSSDSTRMWFEKPWAAGVSMAEWVLFILATPVYFFAADVFHVRALKEVRTTWRRGSKVPLLRRLYRFGSMDMLISLGTSIAYFSSVVQLVVNGVHPDPSGMAKDNSFYFDSVVFLTMFLLMGKLIEAYTKSKTGDAVAMLGNLRPRKAILVDKTNYLGYDVDVDLLEFGDTVRVLQGTSPPSDGIIIEGEAAFNESSLTGESKEVKKVMGDQVFSGTINKSNPITIRITGASGTSMIDQIIEVVREGQTRHAPIERIADTLTSYFVPIITLIAICTWIIWLSLGLSGRLPADYLDTKTGGWASWSLQFAIAVFVVACPCGLGLAAPTAIFAGGGLAAKHGILVKGGGEAFEKASHLDCIVFDKTGTLTMGGEPTVTRRAFMEWGFSAERDILSKIKALEENSVHPIAKAVTSFCKTQGLERREVKDAIEITGKGMKGAFTEGGKHTEMIVGNEALLSDHHVQIPAAISERVYTWKCEGNSIAFVAVSSGSAENSWHVAAVFGISDEIRPEAAHIVQVLQQRGTAVWMLSGDNYESACAIGSQVGIPQENIIAGVLPSDKADKIKYLQKSLGARKGKGNKRALVAMVGDGINDSPALTAADVGIAIGSGSDIAISSADFVLVSSNLHALITLLELSNKVFNRIKFNFGWAMVYNLIGVPVAGGALYALKCNGNHVRLDPVFASLAMALSSISVVCSSLALRSGIPGIGFRSRMR